MQLSAWLKGTSNAYAGKPTVMRFSPVMPGIADKKSLSEALCLHFLCPKREPNKHDGDEAAAA